MDTASTTPAPGTLGVEARGERVELTSPGVGWFTSAVPRGHVLTPGAPAGFLLTLGRAQPLVVPAGVAGVVRSERPEAVHAPVGFGTVLYELEGLEALGSVVAEGAAADTSGGLVFPSPQTGRFWHRSQPGEPPLVAPDQLVEAGTAVGLIEVMKTFTQVGYRPVGGLPARARIVRVLAGDGAEVSKGAPLFEVEPA
jgi:hypothetical protein